MDMVGLSSLRLRLLVDGSCALATCRSSNCFRLSLGLRTRNMSSCPPLSGWWLSSAASKQGWEESRTTLLAGVRRSRSSHVCNIPFLVMSSSSVNRQSSDDDSFDVVILSNGPGEVATWVKPVVESLDTHFSGLQICPRISVVLAPCPHASGCELDLIKSYKEVDRCQGPRWFWKLLLLGSTKDGWNWYRRGVCIFLGGEQLYAVLLGLRLGYKTLIYAEDAVRWPGLVDMYMLRTENLMRDVPSWAHASCKVVGDLFQDAVSVTQHSPKLGDSTSLLQKPSPSSGFTQKPMLEEDHIAIVGLLPGSKGSKLALGVPYFMAVAACLHDLMKGRVRFVLPLAPTATLGMLATHADSTSNPFISQLQWSSGSVVMASNGQTEQDAHKEKTLQGTQKDLLVTSGGVQIEIWRQFPAYDVFMLCTLCLTTVGTNTAELGLLGVPMLVVLPTHALEVFKGATGGVIGLFANMPGWLGKLVAQTVNIAVLKSAGYLAWPNRWASEEVVPELVGQVEPIEVAAIAAHYLKSEGKLKKMQERLLDICRYPMTSPYSEKIGEGSVRGAAEAIAAEVGRLLRYHPWQTTQR